jgi:regulator of protease activity HflC (stomatin/prohibitin superfamily)
MAYTRTPIGSCGCASIPTNATGILESFGKFVETLGPGLACYCCCGGQVYLVHNNIRQLENKTATIDRDQVSLTITTQVQYQIPTASSKTAFYELSDPTSQINSYVDNCLRSYVPRHTSEELFQTKDTASAEVQKHLSDTMSKYGYTIVSVLLTHIALPANVQAAMNARAEQRLLRLAATETAEAARITMVTRSEAEARQMVLMAESKAKEMSILATARIEVDRAKGTGIAQQRAEIASGLERASMAIGSKMGMSGREAMRWVFASQYLEAITTMGSSNKSTMLYPMATSPNDVMRTVMAFGPDVERRLPASHAPLDSLTHTRPERWSLSAVAGLVRVVPGYAPTAPRHPTLEDDEHQDRTGPQPKRRHGWLA